MDSSSNTAAAVSEKSLYSGDYADKPIMLLFQQLIANNSKQNTILTNSQITAILEKEFDLNVAHLHELEVDIYLSVMKKFLKDWPQWDEFDIVFNRLKRRGDVDGIKTLLNKKYNSLKNYLHIMLNAAMPMAKETVQKVEQTVAMKKNSEKDSEKVVLDVQCTRAQLNQLIFKRPHPDRNNTVFNVSDEGPSRILVSKPSYQSMLNWWGIYINISFNCFTLKRETVFRFKHMLVKNNPGIEMGVLNEEMQMKTYPRAKILKKDVIYANIQTLLSSMVQSEYRKFVSIIFKEITMDLHYGDDSILVPGHYRRNFNKYPYTRYLSTDVETSSETASGSDYNLSLQETVVPMYKYLITKLELYKNESAKHHLHYDDCVQIECRPCKIIFTGGNLNLSLQHFMECHQNEPDWTCTNCKKTFSMLNLSSNRWHHEC